MKHSTFALFVYLALAASAAPNPRKSQDISGILSSAISSLSAARASAASVAAASSATAATAVSSVADTSSAAAATSVAVATTVASSAAAASSTAATGSDDSQSSLTLLETVIANGFQDDGNEPPVANQEASQTSSNNFINFCATVEGKPITNGLQIKQGSCVIAAQTNMPSSKFVFPTNGDASIKTNTTFTISMAIKNLETGHFVNAASNYFAAPQIVNAEGNIKGHSHVVIESLPSLDSTEPTDPSTNVFFKGLNDKDVNGILTAEVPGGLPAGFYRLASINTAANHQPALVAVAQHGALDDMVYFTITD